MKYQKRSRRFSSTFLIFYEDFYEIGWCGSPRAAVKNGRSDHFICAFKRTCMYQKVQIYFKFSRNQNVQERLLKWIQGEKTKANLLGIIHLLDSLMIKRHFLSDFSSLCTTLIQIESKMRNLVLCSTKFPIFFFMNPMKISTIVLFRNIN